jgi:hypothetical protein
METGAVVEEILNELQDLRRRLAADPGLDEPSLLEAHKWIFSLLRTGLDTQVWSDAGRPRFTDIVGPYHKWGGDNADAFYCYAPLDPTRRYRVSGRRGDAVYFSLTVYGGPDDGRYSERIVASLNDRQLDIADDGTFEILLVPNEPTPLKPDKRSRLDRDGRRSQEPKEQASLEPDDWPQPRPGERTQPGPGERTESGPGERPRLDRDGRTSQEPEEQASPESDERPQPGPGEGTGSGPGERIGVQRHERAQPDGGAGVRLEADAVCVITRDYVADPRRDRRTEWHIECLDPPASPRRDSDADLARRFRAALTWLREQSRLMLPLEDDNRVDEPYPVPTEAFGWAAGDAAYAMGAFSLHADEALVIEGCSPECAFWNLCLWNPFLHTYDYDQERVTINGHQVVYEPDGSWRIVIAAADPGHPNWISTAGHPRGRLWFRWFLPDRTPDRPHTRVVSLPGVKEHPHAARYLPK